MPSISTAVELEQEAAGNLMAWAKDSSEAAEFAKLYYITLLKYTDNIAIFSTDKNIDDLISLGTKNGWLKLSKINPVTIIGS